MSFYVPKSPNQEIIIYNVQSDIKGQGLGHFRGIFVCSDLHDSAMNSSNALQYKIVILFADDTNTRCSNSIFFQILLRNINAELPKLSKFFRSNKLSLDLKKTKFKLSEQGKTTIIPYIEINLDGDYWSKKG